MMKITSKQYFKVLSLIYLSMILGQVMFMVMVWIVYLQNMQTGDSSLTEILLYVVTGMTIVAIIGGNLIYRFQVSKLKQMADLSLKMGLYRGAVITRFALFEGASFFAIVAVMVTGDKRFLFYPLIIILCFLYWRPRVSKIKADLDLNPEEISRIEDPDAIIIEPDEVL